MKRYVMAVVLVVASGAGLPAQASDRTVTISGVVYGFMSDVALPGAQVRVAEFPDLATVTDASGTYALAVPDDEEITLSADFPGFPTMHLQTFETDGEDIVNAHFQLVPQWLYDTLVQMLPFPVDPGACQIAATVSVHRVRELDWAGQVAFFPHGYEGAEVRLRPQAGIGPIYFNPYVLPDATLTRTSNDGGVLILNVPPGRYRLLAEHPDQRFAKATITCEAGRFINASPPWGLWAKR